MIEGNPANDPARPPDLPSDTSPVGWGGRRYIGLGLVTLALFLGGFGSWSILTEISGAVIASGRLEVQGNRQIVQHPTGGVVDEILARDGDRVEAGAVLLKLDGEQTRSEFAVVEGQHLEMLARMDRFAAERDRRKKIRFHEELVRRGIDDPATRATMAAEVEQFDLRRAAVAEEVAALRERQIQIERQSEGLTAQNESVARQKAIMSQTVARQLSLFEQGIGTKTQLQDSERELARLEGVEGMIAAALAENKARVAEIDIDVLRLGSDLRKEAAEGLRDLEFREIELRERHRALKREIAALELQAPVAGTIYGSNVDTLRSVLRAAEPAMFVVPNNAPLVVQARIEPDRITDVTVGQHAVVRFPSLNTGTTPEAVGRVVGTSADAIHEESGRSYYLVEINLTEIAGWHFKGYDLLPGMPVDLFISTAARSPISYLAKPFTDYLTKAMRES